MVGHMSLEEQVDKDFGLARRKAMLGRIAARLRREALPDGLLCFDEVRRIPGTAAGINRGRRVVPVGQIAGSVGRCSDFDRDFLPARASLGERWKRVDRAFHRGENLPPVSLYRIGGAHFVLDGHHRVSVARYHGVGWVDADVTEFRAGSRNDRGDSGIPIDQVEGGGPKVREMMDPQIWKQRREEMLREVEQDRLAKALRESGKRRGAGRASYLAWELKRIAGRLLKLLRALRKAG